MIPKNNLPSKAAQEGKSLAGLSDLRPETLPLGPERDSEPTTERVEPPRTTPTNTDTNKE